MTDELDMSHHWVIVPHGYEWLYLMGKLIASAPKPAGQDDPRYFMFMRGADWGYGLNPEHYPRDKVQRTFGLKPEQLKCGKAVVLDAPSTKGLPEPTVSYYGEA